MRRGNGVRIRNIRAFLLSKQRTNGNEKKVWAKRKVGKTKDVLQWRGNGVTKWIVVVALIL